MNLMELFANPDTCQNLSMSDKLAGSGITTLMGMGITFCILLLLWAIIAVMTKVIRATDKKNEAMKNEAPVAKTVATEAKTVNLETGTTGTVSDDALIAVISAAIAAYEGEDTVTSDLVVNRIRRVTGPTTTWARAGRNDCIDSRRV